MQSFFISLSHCSAVVALVFAIMHAAGAQDYPSKLIRIVTPAPAGGSGDNYARLIAREFQTTWERSVIVENKSGATGVIATQYVRQAPADGYTLLFTANSQHVVGPLLHNPPPFDAVSDFTPISMVVRFPQFLVVNPTLPVKSVSALVSYAKANPGRLSYASVGAGSNSHLVGEMFNAAAGIDAMHVPYKGAAPAQLAVVSGEAQYRFDNIGTSYPLVQSGKLRGLAITAALRTPAAPDIPTMAEAGVPGIEVYTWLGMLAPTLLPPQVLKKISAELSRITSSAQFVKRAASDGYDVVGSTPEQFTNEMRREIVVTGRIISTRKITAQ